jgi:Zn finger protein HypA/HybF involved in hydrogenase expression
VHEISLAQCICEAVAESGREHGIRRISVVRVTIGRDCQVMHDALLFAFDLIKPVPLMAEAALAITEVPGRDLIIEHIEGVP